MDFAIPTDSRVKMKEIKKIDKYFDLSKELKKKEAQYHESDGDINGSLSPWNGRKETVRTGDQKKNRDLTDHSRVKIN